MYQSIDYYNHLLGSLNGFENAKFVQKSYVISIRYFSRILFPGGDLSDEYLYTANLFYKWSIEVTFNNESLHNDYLSFMKLFDNNKISFPIWGTCLGFEVLLMLTKGSVNVLDTCEGYDFATNINFTPSTNLWIRFEWRTYVS